MSQEYQYQPVPAAVLQVPDTSKICLSSKAFAKQLRLYQSRIADIITMLECKDKGDAFSLKFEFDYHVNAVEGKLTKEANGYKFTLDCYCNGGN